MIAPCLPFFAGALVLAVLGPRFRVPVLLGVPVAGALSLAGLDPDSTWTLHVLGMELTPLRADGLSRLFGWLFHLAAFLAAVFSLHLRERAQHVAALAYVGAALGAVFAGDLLTLFAFWELMALSSACLIWARRSPRALRAGMRYLVVHMVSGVLLLAGALVYLRAEGSLAFGEIGADSVAGWLLLAAFGIKCAFPFVHNWLTDAYPEATPTGTVYLCMFTTKVAVYALARGFPGTELLVYVGVAMTCFPIFYAVIENDLRRVLAYSMINQIGFMVCGIGIGTSLALAGAVAHAFNDVIFKGLLMMSMGAVLHMTGRINGSDLGGLYRSMPKTTALCIVGAASISAFPLFSGFVSKSLVMSAVAGEGYTWVWLGLLFASAGVFHHAGIKIPFFAFFAHDSGIRTTDPPGNMLLAMTVAAALCVAIGCAPGLLYALVPFEIAYAPYTASHVLAQTQLLFFSALAFLWLRLSGLYPPELHSVNLDVEWVYRRFLPGAFRRCAPALRDLDSRLRSAALALLAGGARGLHEAHGPEGPLGRSWSTRAAVAVVVVLLGAYVGVLVL